MALTFRHCTAIRGDGEQCGSTYWRIREMDTVDARCDVHIRRSDKTFADVDNEQAATAMRKRRKERQRGTRGGRHRLTSFA